MKRLVLVVLAIVSVAGCRRDAAPARPADEGAAASTAAGSAPAATPTEAAGRRAPAAAPAEPHPEPASAVEARREPAPTPTPPPRILAAGTALPLTLRTTVASNTSKPDDAVVAALAEDVSASGRLVLPAGTEVRGRVVVAQRSGRVKGRARLVVEFTEAVLDGKAHAIDATRVDVTAGSSKGKDAKIVGGGAAAGAVIGAIADGGEGALKGGLIGGAAGGAAVLATRGEEVALKAGSRVTVKLNRTLQLD